MAEPNWIERVQDNIDQIHMTAKPNEERSAMHEKVCGFVSETGIKTTYQFNGLAITVSRLEYA